MMRIAWSGFGLRASGFGLKGVCAAAVIGAGAPALGQTGALGELRDRYPNVRVYQAGDRVRTVFGTEMTAGQTARDAAEMFVAAHGEVFGSWLDLEEFRDVPMRRAPQGLEKRVFMYHQHMDGLPVVDSSFRVVTLGEPGGGAARVTYAAGRVAIRPQGGLPEPSVSAAQALQAARAHATGARMAQWSGAELVALYDDAPVGSAVGYPAWRLVGAPEPIVDTYTFYVHAVTGEVARVHGNTMHAMDVEGTVEGNATPADVNNLGPDTFATVTASCPNDPDEFVLQDVLLTAYLTGTETLVDSSLTDSAGDYVLDVSASTEVDIYAELTGPTWFVLDGSDAGGIYGYEEIPPLEYTSNPVTAPAAGIDLLFNSVPSEKTTAFVNAHKQMSRVWRWLGAPTDIPSTPVVVHSDQAQDCNGAFIYPNQFNLPFLPWSQGFLRFRDGKANVCVNAAYSTFIGHEYAHYFAWHYLEIEEPGSAFHEGLADSVALLTYNSEIFAESFYGCTSPEDHGRWPRHTDVNHQYPMCQSTTTCSACHLPTGCFGPHCIGELLAALWLDMQDELGTTETRDLFLDWMLIAQLPGTTCCGSPCTYVGQAADGGTLVELLSVADDGDWPEICAVFLARGIDHPDPSPNDCDESAGASCYADCDANRALDVLDFLCFQSEFAMGTLYADCDGNRTLDVLDFICFQDAFTARCP